MAVILSVAGLLFYAYGGYQILRPEAADMIAALLSFGFGTSAIGLGALVERLPKTK